MNRPSYKLPAGHFDKEAAAAASNCAIEGCLCSRTWASRYERGNVLHDFLHPSHPPDGRPRRGPELPETALPNPPAIESKPMPTRNAVHVAEMLAAHREDIRRRWFAGDSPHDIATAYGMTTADVRRAVRGSNQHPPDISAPQAPAGKPLLLEHEPQF